jgi:hypothetical protein
VSPGASALRVWPDVNGLSTYFSIGGYILFLEHLFSVILRLVMPHNQHKGMYFGLFDNYESINNGRFRQTALVCSYSKPATTRCISPEKLPGIPGYWSVGGAVSKEYL